MTVREAVSVLKCAKEINLIWAGLVVPLDVGSELMMDAYGDYKVAALSGSMASGDDFIAAKYELEIAIKPEKEAGHG